MLLRNILLKMGVALFIGIVMQPFGLCGILWDFVGLCRTLSYFVGLRRTLSSQILRIGLANEKFQIDTRVVEIVCLLR